jgi:hypothetical protein
LDSLVDLGSRAPEKLTSTQLAGLAVLIQTGTWKLYRELMLESIRMQAEGLLTENETNRVFQRKGSIAGMRYAILLPEFILKEYDDAERRSRERSADHTASLYGTPGWSKQRPDA